MRRVWLVSTSSGSQTLALCDAPATRSLRVGRLQVVPLLLPDLFAIASAPEAYGPDLQRRALSVAHTVIATLAVMSGALVL